MQYGHPDVQIYIKSSQVHTLPKAKSQAKDKRAKDRRKYSALRFKEGVAPPGFEVQRRMSRVIHTYRIKGTALTPGIYRVGSQNLKNLTPGSQVLENRTRMAEYERDAKKR